jgi:uncharacterized DUF497 family protein
MPQAMGLVPWGIRPVWAWRAAAVFSGLRPRGDDEIRVISSRKATKQEMRRYAES